MRILWVLVLAAAALPAAAQEGPADRLWDLYREGRFEEVVTRGKAELTAGTPTAQVNLAVGRALVDLEKFQESLLYLETAVLQDSDQTWIYAWAKVYLGSAHFRLGAREMAQAAWSQARDCAATPNATRAAVDNLKLLGLAASYDRWRTFSSEHFEFHYSPRLEDFDGVAYARRHEEAFAAVTAWCGAVPADRILFFVWADSAEAGAAGLPPVGFARPKLNLVHVAVDQTVGREMTRVITARALRPAVVVGLIDDGLAVYHDQSGGDRLERARRALEASPAPAVRVSVAALWEDGSLLPEEITASLGAAWVDMLVTRGGRTRFLEFFRDQRLSHARAVYGSDLETWLEELDAALYR